jgi:nucleotide-binding universal stress UspA family protein
VLPFRKILFPVDYSEAAKAVVPYVLDAVTHFKAELTLLHAHGGGTFPYIDLPDADPGWLESIRAAETKRMEDFAREQFPGMSISTIVEEAEPAHAIEAAVKARRIDLVMMPTQGLGPLRRMLLGSVTAKVLHDSATPVWTGTGSALAGHAPGIPYKSILCAVDLEEESKAVMMAAASIAKSYGARLTLLHVVDTPRATYEFDFAQLRQDVMQAAETGMRNRKSELGLDAEHRVIDAAIADGVRQTAAAVKADLMITGRGHALGAVSRLWSHLYPLVREAPCPVLSV